MAKGEDDDEDLMRFDIPMSGTRRGLGCWEPGDIFQQDPVDVLGQIDGLEFEVVLTFRESEEVKRLYGIFATGPRWQVPELFDRDGRPIPLTLEYTFEDGSGDKVFLGKFRNIENRKEVCVFRMDFRHSLV